MDAKTLYGAMACVSEVMRENRDDLIGLDQQNGDGDLGISMDEGYRAAAACLAGAQEEDLGRLLVKCASAFNEAAPSTLGTITAFGLMGMAKALKGRTKASMPEVAEAVFAGVQAIMEKAKSKPGEKTIVDALYPAAEAILAHAGESPAEAFCAAAKAAAEGSERTRGMRPVHGRAVYYGEKGIGLLDGGSAAGRLLFEGLSRYADRL